MRNTGSIDKSEVGLPFHCIDCLIITSKKIEIYQKTARKQPDSGNLVIRLVVWLLLGGPFWKIVLWCDRLLVIGHTKWYFYVR